MVRLIALAALALATVYSSPATLAQQTFPTRTVHFILPFGAASASDTTARLFAERLSARWGKPVVVENRPGGDGLVSLDAFVSAHDDHTMWFGALGSSIDAMLYSIDSMTTRGASGLVVQQHWQMMGALEAVDGMLLFGISTAYIFAVMQLYWPMLSEYFIRRH
jgi:hypothetical protein